MIKRDDVIYKEIESFEDYELTNNTAYEMMTRNKEFQRDRLIFMLNNIHFLLRFLENKDEFNSFVVACEQLELERYPHNEKELLEYKKNHNPKESHENSKILTEKWGIGLNEFVNAYDKDIYSMPSYSYFKVNGEFKFEDEITDLKEDISTHYDLIGVRPKIEIKNLSKVVELKLNLSLPKNELIAIISKIKDKADLGEIKNPLELLGEELQKADDISKMCTINKNGKELCFDGRQGITRTQKIADMFFVYDMLKQGKRELRIRTAISEYYEDYFNKETNLSDTTFRKYRDIATDYIDNLRYKELVTGIKS